MPPQGDHWAQWSDGCAADWFRPCCEDRSFPPERATLSPPGCVPVIAPPGWGSPKPISNSPNHDLRGYALDRVRPCCHNEWVKEGKKRGRLLLRCRVCYAMWKTRPEAHGKCHAFYCGRCKLGGDCPRPHIYARQRKAVPDPGTQVADEVSEGAEWAGTTPATVVLQDGDGARAGAAPLTRPAAHSSAFATPVSTFVNSANCLPLSAAPTCGVAMVPCDKSQLLSAECDDSLVWDPSAEPTEFDTAAFY